MRHLGAALCLAVACFGAIAQPAPVQADRVVIDKERRLLRLYAGMRELARFRVALGREPTGRKECRGDNRTPEGRYRVSGRKENSDFHRALRISYPSPADIQRAREKGCDPGGDIMIHGYLSPRRPPAAPRTGDWTQGCVAVSNEEIERIWRLVPDGAEVEIRP